MQYNVLQFYANHKAFYFNKCISFVNANAYFEMKTSAVNQTDIIRIITFSIPVPVPIIRPQEGNTDNLTLILKLICIVVALIQFESTSGVVLRK